MLKPPAYETPFGVIVRAFAASLAGGRSSYLAPGIPAKKLQGALTGYADGVRPDTVLALCDTTRLGDASEGFLITTAALYLHPRDEVPRSIRFVDIVQWSQILIKNPRGVLTGQRGTCIETRGYAIEISAEEMPLDALQSFLKAVQRAMQQGIVDATDRHVIMADQSDEVKLNYIYSIILLALQNDRKIDSVEMGEIQLLMVRLAFSPHLRATVRAFMKTQSSTIEEVLGRMDAGLTRGTDKVAVRQSLMKDMINIFRRTRGDSEPFADPFMQFVARSLGVSHEQMMFLLDACRLDEEVLAGKLDDGALKTLATNLAAKGVAAGVPLAAVYLSGSVVGLSASGMTSGLAALGLGGILGLSSMDSGIGVVALMGAGLYTGGKYLASRGADARKAEHDARVREIERNREIAQSNMIDDVNQISLELMALQREAEIDRSRLDSLITELGTCICALKGLRNQKNRQPET